MTVYVDEPIHGYGRMIMCHMASPDLAELHAMADKIGVARRWFQDPRIMPKVSRPHYDIAKSKRAMAVIHGAVEVNKYQMVVVTNVAFARLHGVFFDPFKVFRGKEGRPDHPQLAGLLAWWADQT